MEALLISPPSPSLPPSLSLSQSLSLGSDWISARSAATEVSKNRRGKKFQTKQRKEKKGWDEAAAAAETWNARARFKRVACTCVCVRESVCECVCMCVCVSALLCACACVSERHWLFLPLSHSVSLKGAKTGGSFQQCFDPNPSMLFILVTFRSEKKSFRPKTNKVRKVCPKNSSDTSEKNNCPKKIRDRSFLVSIRKSGGCFFLLLLLGATQLSFSSESIWMLLKKDRRRRGGE